MSLEQKVRAELDGWGLADSALGAAALDLARRLGKRDLKPAAAAMLHGQLRGYLHELRSLAPEEVSDDGIDEVQQRREKRRSAAGTA